MSDELRSQKPVDQQLAQTFAEMWRIVTHPAFRLGFLDAMAGKPIEHDAILDRIAKETPAGALKRLGWHDDLFSPPATFLSVQFSPVPIAQYRYEEGRQAVLDAGLRCKAWGHPDFPPAAVRRFIEAKAKERATAVPAR